MIKVIIAFDGWVDLSAYLRKNAWGGAEQIIAKISQSDAEKEIYQAIYDFADGFEFADETQFNDFIWFEIDEILETFGLY